MRADPFPEFEVRGWLGARMNAPCGTQTRCPLELFADEKHLGVENVFYSSYTQAGGLQDYLSPFAVKVVEAADAYVSFGLGWSQITGAMILRRLDGE